MSPRMPSTASLRLCRMPLRLCPMPLRLCPMPLRLCPMPLRLCPMPLRLCRMPLRLCLMPLRLCPMPLRLCPMPLRLRLMPWRLCPMPLSLHLMPLHLCPMPLRLCPMPLRLRLMPLRLCPMPLRLCLMPLRLCRMPLRLCLMPLRLCRMPLRLCHMPLRLCLMPLRMSLAPPPPPHSPPRAQVRVSLAGGGRVLVWWVTAGNTAATVEYGESRGKYTKVASGSVTGYRSGYIHKVLLGRRFEDGVLKPGTTYFYRLGGTGPEFAFKTPPLPGNPIDVALMGGCVALTLAVLWHGRHGPRPSSPPLRPLHAHWSTWTQQQQQAAATTITRLSCTPHSFPFFPPFSHHLLPFLHPMHAGRHGHSSSSSSSSGSRSTSSYHQPHPPSLTPHPHWSTWTQQQQQPPPPSRASPARPTLSSTHKHSPSFNSCPASPPPPSPSSPPPTTSRYGLRASSSRRVAYWSTQKSPPPLPPPPPPPADMGCKPPAAATISCLSHTPHSLVVFPGDLSYANGYQPDWDKFQSLIQPVASLRPWMTGSGNHEDEADEGAPRLNPFKVYSLRWPMPAAASRSPSNLYYSFDSGSIHWVMLSCYSDYSQGSAQYKWLQADLDKVVRRVTSWLCIAPLLPSFKPPPHTYPPQVDLAKVDRKVTPWLIAAFHEAWYHSNKEHHLNGEAMQVALEKTLYDARTDVVVCGHVHSYERTRCKLHAHGHACGHAHGHACGHSHGHAYGHAHGMHMDTHIGMHVGTCMGVVVCGHVHAYERTVSGRVCVER
ncbi:unnamed protein product [Closterium sp. Naga37s-1]|nr:unnamed protein product [Closterium sp. Naga37s-1]